MLKPWNHMKRIVRLSAETRSASIVNIVALATVWPPPMIVKREASHESLMSVANAPELYEPCI